MSIRFRPLPIIGSSNEKLALNSGKRRTKVIVKVRSEWHNINARQFFTQIVGAENTVATVAVILERLVFGQ